MFFRDIRRAIQLDIFPVVAQRFDAMYSTMEISEPGSRGPRVRGHHTTLSREKKERKVPVAVNKGIVGKETSVLSGGEVIERDGKRKHWRQLDDEMSEAMEIMDEEDHVEGELLTEGELEMIDEKVVGNERI